MKQPPRGASFDKTPMKKVDFLQAALQRLNDDVGTILDLVEGYNKKSQRQIGFWASIRMIMPIIEAISHVVGESPQNFIGNHLNVDTSFLAWDLFRHSLMHGDYLQHGKYQTKDVSWGVLMLGKGHIIKSGHIGIDVRTLYEDLKKYLEDEVAKNDQTTVDIEIGVIYSTPRQEIIDDFSKI